MSTAPTPAPTPAEASEASAKRPRKRKPIARPPVPSTLAGKWPLNWHKRGYWYKKLDGHKQSFGAEPVEAYSRYRRFMEARAAGDTPLEAIRRHKRVRDAVNAFLRRQARKVDDGRLRRGTLARNRQELIEQASIPASMPLSILAGKRGPDVFEKMREAALNRGPSAAEKHITCWRACLASAVRDRLMLAPNYDGRFDPPTAEDFQDAREARHQRRRETGNLNRPWTPADLRKLIETAIEPTKASKIGNPHMRAWVLLGLNAAYGAEDIATVPESAWDQERGTLAFPRPKTRRPRMTLLWPETIEALRASIALRPSPADDELRHRMFLNRHGGSLLPRYESLTPGGVLKAEFRTDYIARAFSRLCNRAGVPAHGFYTLRSQFRTLALGAPGADPDLVALVMGRRFSHPLDDYYVRGDLREKLRGLLDHVRAQVFQP